MAVWSCNYDPNVIYDDGSSEHELFERTEGACNYDEEATFDDGSCDFCRLPHRPQRSEPLSRGLDGRRVLSVFRVPFDPEGLDYDPTATYPGERDYPDPCPGDYTGDGVVDINDLLDFFQLWGDV